MASSRQIEHLERKHQENPEGLTFAPLANAYRSSGQPERAIDTLMEGLEHHPDHAPARIVLGRCHLDLGDEAAAETAFAQVFDLDKENVVALKALADIAERASRFDDAARWLGYLLEADRDNREAREQLNRVSYTKEIATGDVDAVSHEAAQEVLRADDTPEYEEAEEEAEEQDQGAEASSDEAVTGPGIVVEEAEPFVFGTPWGGTPSAGDDTVDEESSDHEAIEDEVAEEEAIDEEVSPAAESFVEQPFSSWEPPAIASEVTEGQDVSDLDGPGGPSDDEPGAEIPNWLPAEPVVEEDPAEKDLEATVDSEDEAGLTPGAANEFQTPDTEGLSLQARAENELLVEKADEDFDLSASEDNEFQPPSDAELLRPSVAEDVEEQSNSLEATETNPFKDPEDPGSWFSPAPEETAASVAPESGPDGTPEPLETAFASDSDTAEEPQFEAPEPPSSPWGPAEEVAPDGTPEPLDSSSASETDTPAKPPFEESEPLPSSWGPAGDVEEEIRAESVESPLVGSEVSQQEEASRFDMTPDEEARADVELGSPVEDETAGDAELSEDDVYPEVLGSDQDEEPPMEAEPLSGSEPEPEPAFVATETMAEVYLSQGHRLEALDVYRVLLESTPGDSRLSEKVSALEQELESGMQAGDEVVPEADEFPVESGTSYAASATGGQTVKALFQDLLATKPAAGTPPEAPPAQEARDLVDNGQNVVGEPTRPAQDPLSLSAIFGEDTSPVPPALGRGAVKDEAEKGFSFDNFFGDEAGESVSKGPSGSPPKGREPEDDLDQFQSWLQGLKG